jgi:hypothetical protein
MKNIINNFIKELKTKANTKLIIIGLGILAIVLVMSSFAGGGRHEGRDIGGEHKGAQGEYRNEKSRGNDIDREMSAPEHDNQRGGDRRNHNKLSHPQSPFEIWIDAQETKFDNLMKSIVGEKVYTFFDKPERSDINASSTEYKEDGYTNQGKDATTTIMNISTTSVQTATGTVVK